MKIVQRAQAAIQNLNDFAFVTQIRKLLLQVRVLQVHDNEQLVERITGVEVRHNQIVQHCRMFVVGVDCQLPQCLDFGENLP